MKLILICLLSSIAWITTANTDTLSSNNERSKIVEYAQTFIGVPYVWGGSSKNGFDCSGFVYHVFKHFNRAVSRTSKGFENKGTVVQLTESQPGDIILFTGTNASDRTIGHVGIILKNDNGIIDFIHSSSAKKHFGVTITRYNESGYVKRFIKTINVIS